MPLPLPNELKSLYPLSQESALAIATNRKQITELIQGKDSRLALILGPCSLHNEESAIEYAIRLKSLQDKVKDTCLLVMRSHIEKPRTYLGWKGLLYDPDLSGEENLAKGLIASRQILFSLVRIGVPLACEFLDPLASCYLSDLISWGFIGARTASSQTHRQLASSLLMPVGFKNSTDGNWESALYGALVASRPHSFLHMNDQGKLTNITSMGNPYSHLVLRGSDTRPNYDPQEISAVLSASEEKGLFHRLLIDCSHGNSRYNPSCQRQVFRSVLDQGKEHKTKLLGMMIESHIQEGKQPFSSSSHSPYISVTDGCIGWSETEELVLSAHAELSSLACSCSS